MTNTFLSGADVSGDVQLINVGTNDDSVPIYYELESQEIEFGDRSHLKKIQNKCVTLTQKANGSTIEIKGDDENYKILPIKVEGPISISDSSSFKCHFLTFKWLGNSSNLSPVLDGFYIKEIIDNGQL